MSDCARASVYVFQGSHPCEAVLAALRFKGIAFRRVEVPPVLHRAVIRARFPSGTAPAMRIGERRIQGTSQIFRALDELAPGQPLLFPPGPAGAAVAEAEGWGAGDLQDSGRRIVWGHFRRSRSAMRAWADTTDDPVARAIKRVASRPAAIIASTAHHATDDRVAADLAGMPAVLDHVDELIAQGVIGAAMPNAADFQILSTLGVWMALADLRPAILPRPCGAASARLFPEYVARPGLAAGALPEAWLAPVRATLA